MTGTLKVTPEKLRSTASEFNGQGQKVNQLTSQMMSQVTGLAAVWQGTAAQTYINKFKGLQDDIQRMCRMITEHVNDLNEMAAGYTSAENKAAEWANTLSSDVIV